VRITSGTNPLCDSTQLDWSTWVSVNGSTAIGTISSNISVSVTMSTGGLFTTSEMFNGGVFPPQYNVPVNNLSIANSNAGLYTFCFSSPIIDPQIALASVGNPSTTVPINTSACYEVIWPGQGMTYPSNTTLTGFEGYTIIKFPGEHTCISFDYLISEHYCNLAFGIMDTNCQQIIPPAICAGSSVTLTATGATTYTWSPSTGLNTTVGSVVTATPLVSTKYYVTGTGNNCTAVDSIIVTVNQLPVASITGDSIICTGESTTLNASGGIGYLWNTSETNPSISVSPTVTTTYTVTITNAGGCTGTATKVITVNLPPVVTFNNSLSQQPITSTNYLITGGTPAGGTYSGAGVNGTNFNASVAGVGIHTITYTYTDPITGCIGSATNTIQVNDCQGFLNGGFEIPYQAPGNYALVADNIVTGWNTTASDHLIEIWGTGFNGVPSYEGNQFAEVNATMFAALYQDVPSIPGDTMPWSFAHRARVGIDEIKVNIGPPGSTVTQGTFSSPTTEWQIKTGVYVVPSGVTTTRFEFEAVSTGSGSISVGNFIDDVKFSTALASNNSAICAGDTLNLYCTPFGAVSFQWSGPNGFSSTLQNPSIPNATIAASGDYTVTVTKTTGCTATAVTTVIVNENVAASASSNSPVCAGNLLQLSCSPPTAQTYSWSGPNGFVSSLQNPDISNVTTNASGTYTVSITNIYGCSDTSSVSVSVNQSPTVNAGPDQMICEGLSTTLTASGGNTYQWNGGPATVTNFVTPSVTTTYSVTAFIGNCTDTDNVTVIVLNPIPIEAGDDTTICAGGSVQLNASGGLMYSWTPSTGLNSTTISNPLATPLTTTTYYVSSQVPVGNVIINGDFEQGNTSFTSSYLFTPPPNSTESQYWVAPGNQVGSWNSGMFSNGDHTTGTGNFLIVNGAGTPGTNVWCQTIDVMPNTEYDFSTWVSSMNNNSPAILQFYINGSLLGSPFNAPANWGSWAQFFSIWNSGTNTSADICVINQNTNFGGNDFGLDDISFSPLCNSSDSIVVTVNQFAIAEAGPNVAICRSDSTQLNASGGNIYLWTPSDSLTSTGINNPLAFPDQSTIYTVTVTDNNGCSSTDNVTVTVNNNPLVNHTLTNITCNGLNDGTITANPYNGLFPYNFSWSTFPAQTTQTATGLSPNVNYTVTVTDDNGCTATDSYILTEPSALSMTFSYSDALCFNSCDGQAEAIVTGGITPYNYIWTPLGTGGNVSTLNTLCAENYTLTVKDSNNCQIDTSFTISQPNMQIFSYVTSNVQCFDGTDGSIAINNSGGTQPYSYNWSPSVSNDTSASNLSAGHYDITITDSHQCDTIFTVTVTQPPLLELSTSGNDTVCIGESYTLSSSATGGVLPYVFTWDNNLGNGDSFTFSGSQTTTYSVFVSDSNNCSTVSQNMEVFVHPVIDVVVSFAGDSAFCLNNSTQLSAVATGGNGGPYTYTWNAGIGVQNPPITITPSQTTTYIVTASDNCGSPTATDSLTVIVYPLPVVNFSATPISGCEPLLVSFTDLSYADIASWHWQFGDSGSNNESNQQHPSHTYQNDGIYSVMLTTTTINGCTGNLLINNYLEVYPLPKALFTFHPDFAEVENSDIYFWNESTACDLWRWDFGDPSSGNQNYSFEWAPMHVYNAEGSYTIWLVVSSDKGCLDSTYSTLIYRQEETFYIPNAFTPDNDGLNDYFGPEGIGFDMNDYQMYIYDRWGGLVFKTEDLNYRWNGRHAGTGNEEPMDVYSWIIILNTKTYDKPMRKFVGHVTLLR